MIKSTRLDMDSYDNASRTPLRTLSDSLQHSIKNAFRFDSPQREARYQSSNTCVRRGSLLELLDSRMCLLPAVHSSAI